MSYDQSKSLLKKHEAQELTPPPQYSRRLSVQWLLRRWAILVAVMIIALAALLRIIGMQWWYVPPILIGGYFFYRDFWRWRHNWLTCSPEDGVLRIEDNTHPFILMFINGSTDDHIPLSDVKLDTPTRSLVDRLFGCDVLVIGDRTIRNVKDAARLQSIQKYQESLDNRSATLSQQQVDIGRATLETMESIGVKLDQVSEQLANIVRLMETERASRQIRPTEPMPATPSKPASKPDSASKD